MRILQVGSLHCALYVLPDDEYAIRGMSCPPLDERFVVGRLVSDFPINLRHQIVHPALFHPEEDVGIEVVIVLQARRVAAWDGGARFCVVVDAERRDAEFYPGFHVVNAVVEGLDEDIDIVAPPVLHVGKTIVVAAEGFLVGNFLARSRVGVEVVVNVEAVHIVAAHDVGSHAAGVFAAIVP